jgi:hypothetical protein
MFAVPRIRFNELVGCSKYAVAQQTAGSSAGLNQTRFYLNKEF